MNSQKTIQKYFRETEQIYFGLLFAYNFKLMIKSSCETKKIKTMEIKLFS